jgi:branched-chain amino acid transport system ATP-binding protein
MLEINDLDVYYGPIQALHGLTLHVQEGEAVAVLGANGAGKSTLIKTVMGFLKPRQGEIRFGGQSINALPSWERVARGLALVPEGGRVFRDMSVKNNLRLGAYPKDERQIGEQMEFVLELFPALAERKDQIAKTLSGGEQQMLAIGRALMSAPRLLLIDEASLGLSPALAKTVFEVVARINEGGTTVIIVEQNIGVLPYADRALIMEKGTIVYHGVGDEIRDANLRETYLGGEDGE